MIKRIVGLVAVLSILAPGAALAHALAEIHVTPDTPAPGDLIQLHGKAEGCAKGDQVILISTGFKGSHHEFAGDPTVVARVGRHSSYSVDFRLSHSLKHGLYRVSGRCGGGLFGEGHFDVR